MIYSFDHNFLMLKNYKVGGTSLEVELSKILPNNAIVTEIFPKNVSHKPRNFDGFYNHMTYSEVAIKIDLSMSKSYVFVRNPYEVVLSNLFYDFKISNKNDLNIKDFVNIYMEKDMIKSTKKIYTDNLQNIIVDKVFKYEDGIEDQINYILPEHNLPKIKINTFEKNFTPKKIKYYDVFSKNQINKIYEEWEWEFDTFGYFK